MALVDRLLPNGIRFLAEPIAATKAAAIGFWFSRGSRDEGAGEYGITHFVEHMLFKGTATRTSFELSRYFDRLGGYINAFTERELLCLYCVVPSSHALDAVAVLRGMITGSEFADSEIEKERTVIISEILASQDDPDEMGADAALGAMYPGHGISRAIAGSIGDIEELETGRIRDFYCRHFMSAAPIVTVAGNIDADSLSRALESWSARDEPHSSSGESPLWKAGRASIVSQFSQSQIFLSYPLKSVKTSADWFSWACINAIIGDTVSSRLFQSLREKKGLCYSSYSLFSINRDSGLWTAYAATPPEKTAEAAETLITEIDVIRSGGFRETEMEDARLHLIGELELSSEDTENRMKRIARQFFFNGRFLTIEESVALVRSIDGLEVRQQMQNAFISQDESLILYAGKKQLKECRKLWR